MSLLGTTSEGSGATLPLTSNNTTALNAHEEGTSGRKSTRLGRKAVLVTVSALAIVGCTAALMHYGMGSQAGISQGLQAAQSWDDVYNAVDTNNDKSISSTELSADLENIGVLANSTYLASIIATAEASSDPTNGQVDSVDEFKLYSKAVCTSFDSNGDGEISEEELKAMAKSAGMLVSDTVVSGWYEEAAPGLILETEGETCHLLLNQLRSRGSTFLTLQVCGIVDSNFDGFVNVIELKAYLFDTFDTYGIAPADAQTIISRSDTQDPETSQLDGKISSTECDSLFHTLGHGDAAVIDNAWTGVYSTVDADSNNCATVMELWTFWQMSREYERAASAFAIFSAHDSDNNNCLSAIEYSAVMEDLIQEEHERLFGNGK